MKRSVTVLFRALAAAAARATLPPVGTEWAMARWTGCLLAVAFAMIGHMASAQVAADAASPALPKYPFSATVYLPSDTPQFIGANQGKRLGVTSLTLSNFTQSPAVIYVSSATATTSCATATLSSQQHMRYVVAPYSTSHITYPTPWTFARSGSLVCVGFQVLSAPGGYLLEASVTGFLQ